MIIITAKVPRLKFAPVVSALSGVCAVALIGGLVSNPYEPAVAVQSPVSHQVKNGNQRIEYLSQWGWEVAETPLATQTMKIPDVLTEDYATYVQMQIQQGFPSLGEFCGGDVIQYTYQVLNYPTGQEGVQVNLLCYESQVIAGEVLSPEINGFLHGLSYPTEG